MQRKNGHVRKFLNKYNCNLTPLYRLLEFFIMSLIPATSKVLRKIERGYLCFGCWHCSRKDSHFAFRISHFTFRISHFAFPKLHFDFSRLRTVTIPHHQHRSNFIPNVIVNNLSPPYCAAITNPRIRFSFTFRSWFSVLFISVHCYVTVERIHR